MRHHGSSHSASFRRKMLLIALLFAAANALSAPVVHASPTRPYAWVRSWIPRDTASLAASPGFLIYLDPETRRPARPSEAQRRAASEAAAEAPRGLDAPLPVVRLPGGGELVHLQGRHQVYSVARRDASGRITTDCVADSALASQILTRPAPPPRQWEDR